MIQNWYFTKWQIGEIESQSNLSKHSSSAESCTNILLYIKESTKVLLYLKEKLLHHWQVSVFNYSCLVRYRFDHFGQAAISRNVKSVLGWLASFLVLGWNVFSFLLCVVLAGFLWFSRGCGRISLLMLSKHPREGFKAEQGVDMLASHVASSQYSLAWWICLGWVG